MCSIAERSTTPKEAGLSTHTNLTGPVLSRCAFAALNSDFTSGFADMADEPESGKALIGQEHCSRGITVLSQGSVQSGILPGPLPCFLRAWRGLGFPGALPAACAPLHGMLPAVLL